MRPKHILMDTAAKRTRGAAHIPAPFGDRKGDVQVAGHDSIAEVVSALVERARGGNREAFAELYQRFVPPVARLAHFYLQGGVEDAVAETFVRAWAALPRYRDTGAPFVSWLYGIARHVVADELAARRRVEPRSELPDAVAPPSWTEDRLALTQAMDRLPREQRQVVELKFLAGMTNPEVARALGKTVGAVNSLQWRALRALKGTVPR